MLKANNRKMTEGAIVPGLMLFALPILISNLLQLLYGTMDAAIVGKYVGENAFAAVTNAEKIINTFVSFFLGLGAGAGVIVSHHFGAKDDNNLSKSLHTAILLTIIFGVFLSLLMPLINKPLLKIISTPAELLNMSYDYLRINFYGIIFTLIFNIGSGILRSMGDSLTPLLYLMITVVLNIGLNYLFVGLLGLGIAGAACTTLISQGVAAILILVRMATFKKCPLKLKKLRIDKVQCKKIIAVGLPLGLQNSVIAVAHLVMQNFINGFSDLNIIKGLGAYSKIDGYVALPLNSFSVAITAFVGQNVGAGNYKRALKGGKICLLISELMTIVMGVIIFFACVPLLKFFGLNSPEAIDYGYRFMIILVVSYPVLVLCHILAGIIRGTGKTLVPSLALIGSMCFLRILFILTVMPFWDSIYVILLSYPITWVAATIVLVVYYFKGNWLYPSKNQTIDKYPMR